MNDSSPVPSVPAQLGEHLRLPRMVDERGILLPIDFADLPFLPNRMFIVHDVPTGQRRGRHAHRSSEQLFVRLAGKIGVELRRGELRQYVTLDRSDEALRVPAGTWAAQDYLEPGSMLLVLASEAFDPASYITDAP